MALPLPKVIPDTLPGGGMVTAMRGANSLAQDQMENVIKGAQADYAPWTTYADAASKMAYSNMLPYQVQATIMSNPMVWAGYQQLKKERPEAAANMLNNLMSSIPSATQMTPGANMPPRPNSLSPRGDGLLSMAVNSLKSLMGGGQSSPSQLPPQGGAMPPALGGSDLSMSEGTATPAEVNQMAYGGQAPASLPAQTPAAPVPAGQTNLQGSALAPASGDMFQGVVGESIAKYLESPFTPGKPFVDMNGDLRSAPDAQMTQQLQQGMQGIKDITPILTRISKGAPKWLSSGMEGQLKALSSLNWMKKNIGEAGGLLPKLMKQTGVTTKDLSEYAAWQADIQKAGEVMMKARSWPQNEVSQHKIDQIIQPLPGEGPEYGDRVAKELAQEQFELLPSYKQSAGGGYILQPSQSQAAPAAAPEASFSVSVAKPNNAKEAIKQTADEFKSETIKMIGLDPKTKKLKVWDVPQGQAQLYLDAGFKRAKNG